MELNNLEILLPLIGFIVIIVNMLTQVIKKITWKKLPTNLLVFILSEIITISGGIAYCQYFDIQIVYYTLFMFVVVGIGVTYSAMFGFDKFKETIYRLDIVAKIGDSK